MPMKLATYNILKGGAQRVHWLKMIEEYSVDLLLVQESTAPDQHLPPLLFPGAQSQSVWKMVEQHGWGSGVYSKSGSMRPLEVTGFSGWVVGAEIHGAAWQTNVADSILAFSVHAPSRLECYAKQVNKLLDEIGRISGGRELVIGGDFNLTVSHWPGSERPVSNQDLAIQARLSDEFGLLNCWQQANPDQPLQQTLRWSRDRTIAYHCDGLFVPKAWKKRLQTCTVLTGEEWDRLSDHNPVLACFC